MEYIYLKILNFFPRKFLIKVSFFLRPIFKLIYKGDKFIDPIDGSSYRKFLSYGYKKIRKNALCPGTLSLERHRYLWLYITNETSILTKPLIMRNLILKKPNYVIFISHHYCYWKNKQK